MTSRSNSWLLTAKQQKPKSSISSGHQFPSLPVPVGEGAGVLVLLELHTHHVEELVGIGAQVVHQVHQVLNGLLHNYRALEKKEKHKYEERFSVNLNFSLLVSC